MTGSQKKKKKKSKVKVKHPNLNKPKNTVISQLFPELL